MDHLSIDLLNPSSWAIMSLQRIRVEYVDPINHLSFFIIVHSHSKRLEIFSMKSTTPAATIQELYLFLQFMSSPTKYS